MPTIVAYVAGSTDDAIEDASGYVTVDGASLGGESWTGLRFPVNIPAGSTVTSAVPTIYPDAAGTANAVVYVEAADDAAAFTESLQAAAPPGGGTLTDFEDIGTPDGWVVEAGSPDFDATTPVMVGTKHLALAPGESAALLSAPSTGKYITFMMHVESRIANEAIIVHIMEDQGGWIGYMGITRSGEFFVRINGQGTIYSPEDQYTPGVNIWVKLHVTHLPVPQFQTYMGVETSADGESWTQIVDDFGASAQLFWMTDTRFYNTDGAVTIHIDHVIESGSDIEDPTGGGDPNHDISGRTRTIDAANWTGAVAAGGFTAGPDLTDAVQEWVDRPGRTAASHMALIIAHAAGCGLSFRSYDFNPTFRPAIAIDYDEPETSVSGTIPAAIWGPVHGSVITASAVSLAGTIPAAIWGPVSGAVLIGGEDFAIRHMQPPGKLMHTELAVHLWGFGFQAGPGNPKLTAVPQAGGASIDCDGVVHYGPDHVAGIWSDGLAAGYYGIVFTNGDGTAVDLTVSPPEFPDDGIIEIFAAHTGLHKGRSWGGVLLPLEIRGVSADGTVPEYPAKADTVSDYLPQCPVCGVMFDSRWHPVRKGGRKLCRICAQDE